MAILSVKASGLVTAIGFNSSTSLAALRAGISGVKEANLWDAESGEYLPAAKVDLPQWWETTGKLAELVTPAIHECLVAAEPTPPEQIPFLLGVAALNRPHRFEGLDDQLLDKIEYRLGLQHHPASKIIPRGRVSAVVGILEAIRLIKDRQVPFCIVSGVDGFLRQNVVEAYIEQQRVMTPNNSNGFFPGEAGAATLVGPNLEKTGDVLQILGVGMARETATIESDQPFKAVGLTQAIREALSNAGLTIFDMAYRITDLNGEHYKFKEATIATARFENKPVERPFDIWHPIEYIGEIGAAIGPCTFAVALHAGQKGWAPGACALCHFSNDDGERAAVVVRFHREDNN